MKKLLLFVSITTCSLLLTSCSNDDNKSTSSSSSKVSFKINGVAKTLNSVSVNTSAPDADGDVTLTVAATDGGTNNVSIEVYRGELGANGHVTFYMGGTLYYTSYSGFTSYFTQNDEHHLKGTFSGEIYNAATGNQTGQISEGVFDINY